MGKTPIVSTNQRGAFNLLATQNGWEFWEDGFCPVCTGKVPAIKYKKKGDPSMTLWILYTKGQFEIKRYSKRVIKAPLNTLKDALRLHK